MEGREGCEWLRERKAMQGYGLIDDVRCKHECKYENENRGRWVQKDGTNCEEEEEKNGNKVDD